MPSPFICHLFLGRGHDTILPHITCKKARIWTSFWDRKQYRWFALFQLAKMSPSISCYCLHFYLRKEQRIHMRVRCEISAGSVFFSCFLSLIHWNIFHLTVYLKGAVKNSLIIWIKNRFTFQITNSWMESWPGLDCNSSFRNPRIILSALRFQNTF